MPTLHGDTRRMKDEDFSIERVGKNDDNFLAKVGENGSPLNIPLNLYLIDSEDLTPIFGYREISR